MVSCRAQQTVEVKKKLVEEQTTAILAGQTELGEQRKKVRDLQAQLLQIQESKKAAVTGMHGRCGPMRYVEHSFGCVQVVSSKKLLV